MKKIQIFLIGLVAIIGIIGVVILTDPFNWHIGDRFGSEYDAVLTAIPADSLAYVGVNLLQYDADAWDKMSGEGESNIDETVYALTGLHLMEEAKLWMEQYAGVAILSLTQDEAGTLSGVEWLLVAEVRDEESATHFIEKEAATKIGLQNAIVENGRLLLPFSYSTHALIV